MKVRRTIISVLIAIAFIFPSSMFMLPVTQRAQAFPDLDPQVADYYFYDDFEGTGSVIGTNGWTGVQGDVVFTSNQSYHGSNSAYFGACDGSNHYIQRTIAQNSVTDNENIVLECKFYDNASVTSQDPETQFRMVVGGDHATISMGIKLALPLGQRMYSIWVYDDTYAGTGYRNLTTIAQRTTGWHDFKVLLNSHTQYSFYVDQAYVGNVTLGSTSAAAGMTYYNLFAVGNSPPIVGANWWVDSYIIYPFYQDHLWSRKSIAVNNNLTHNAFFAIEPTVLYESGTYKVWYDSCAEYAGSSSVGYATSTDALNWTDYGSTVVSMGTAGYRPFVAHIGSTYYLYYTNETGYYGDRHFMRRTSSNGISWSSAVDTNLGCSPVEGAWNHRYIGNINVWIEGSVWYAIYEGASNETMWTDGLATSTDGLSWTPYPSNPILPAWFVGGGPDIHKIGSTYYMFVHGILTSWVNNKPTDIVLFQSNDLITWTNCSFFVQRTREIGYQYQDYQVADASYFEGYGDQAGRHFMMYEGTINGTDQGRLYVDESDYSLTEIVNGDILQWGKHLMGLGVTNNCTSDGTYWYSGMNAIHGMFTDNLTLTTTSDVNITISSMSQESIAWVGNPGAGDPSVEFTASNLLPSTTYYVKIDGWVVQTINSSVAGELSFNYSGPWGSHTFEVTTTLNDLSSMPMVNLILMMFALGVVVGPMAWVVKLTKLKKPPTIGEVIHVVIFIIVGLSAVGIVYGLV